MKINHNRIENKRYKEEGLKEWIGTAEERISQLLRIEDKLTRLSEINRCALRLSTSTQPKPANRVSDLPPDPEMKGHKQTTKKQG